MAYTILGGKLAGPVDLTIYGQLPVSLATAQANCDSCAARNLPGLQPLSRVGIRLAVVGGGPSIRDHVDELKAWDGEIWAINGAWAWCHKRDIEATLFAIDAHPIVCRWTSAEDGSKPKRAILAMTCDPQVFDLLAETEVNAISHGRDQLRGGSSTAGLAPHLAALMGYNSVTFFGCESSYAADLTHAYQHETRDEQMIVAADGCDYLTAPDFMMQAKELATFINEFPEYLSEKSGGLLRAMISDLKAEKQPQIKWLSDGVVANLGQAQHGSPVAPSVPVDDWSPETEQFEPQTRHAAE